MYNDDLIAIPKDNEHFWKMAEENFEFARHVLEDYHLQTRDEAISDEQTPAFLVLAYRPSEEGMDQRDYCYQLGRSLLPKVKALLEHRKFTAEFVQEWGKLMYCHGVMVPYIFTEKDTLSESRRAVKSAAKRSTLTHRQWLAHIFALPMFANLKRWDADEQVGHFLKSLSENPEFLWQCPKGWFSKILNNNGTLRSTFCEKNFSKNEMEYARTLPFHSDMPPVPDRNS